MTRQTLRMLAGAGAVLLALSVLGSASALAGNTEVTEDNDDDGHPNAPDPEGDADNKHPSGRDKHDEAGGSGNQGNAQSDPDDDGRGPDRSNGGKDQPGGSGGSDQLDQDGNNGCGNDDDFEDDNEGLCLGRQGPKDNGNDDGLGPDADITITADCFSVTVTSTKDISFVEVTFADGTVVKFEGLTGTSFSRTFAEELASARAKSGTTIVTDTAEGDCDEVGGQLVCPEGTDMAGLPPTEDGCNEDEEVLGGTIDAGMPADPSVLGRRITNAANDDAASLLPFTGASVITFVVIALALLAVGALVLRARRAS